jgi:hypothetical protein
MNCLFIYFFSTLETFFLKGIVVGDDGTLMGASDWRKEGLAAGY